jgi:uncharacterized Zn-binding protein involved in type VI secretion
MPATARVGDTVMSVDGTGYRCQQPMETSCGQTTGNTKVYANGILVVVQGDPVAPHNMAGCTPDMSTLTSFSGKVRACGKGVGRIGDQYTGGTPNTITQGSSTVFAGG